MKKFSLLETLTKQAEDQPKKPKLTDGIKYDEYNVSLYNNDSKTVYIPIRESENFEQTLSDVDILTKNALRDVLRKHNGVTEI